MNSRRPLLAAVAIFAAVSISGVVAQTPTATPCNPPGTEFVTIKVIPPSGPEATTRNVPYIPGETVALAMSNAKHVNPAFTYETAEFCPFGRFVTSINGLAESGPYYWFLYVNNVRSDQGMDTKGLAAGDEIVWKAEQFTTESKSHQAMAAAHRMSRRLGPSANEPK